MLVPTHPLYLDTAGTHGHAARLLAVRDDALAFDATLFYPGGGGQPHDRGVLQWADGSCSGVAAVARDASGVIWHRLAAPLPAGIVPGAVAEQRIDSVYRRALSRHHTVLHILNTVALREHGAWITGAQVGDAHSRIDFNLDTLSAALIADLQARVVAVIAAAHPVHAERIPEDAFRARDDLRRSLDVAPPVRDGHVRIVHIDGFDAQACGGTHVASTAEIGAFTITRSENKGRVNKRLYVSLAQSA